MHSSIKRYVLPTIVVTGCAAVIAPVIAQPGESQVIDQAPVEHSTVVTVPEQPLVIEPITVTAEEALTKGEVSPLPEQGVEHSTVATDYGAADTLAAWEACEWPMWTDTVTGDCLPPDGSGDEKDEPALPVFPEFTIRACSSDGPGDEEAPCYWDASEMGDLDGTDFILWTDGNLYHPEG